MANTKTRPAAKPQRVEGEGSYSATRDYNKHLGSAVADKKKLEKGADAARRAVEGPEGASLRAAEAQGKAGPRMAAKRAR